MDIDDFNAEAWRSMSEGQRRAMVDALMNTQHQIMAHDVACMENGPSLEDEIIRTRLQMEMQSIANQYMRDASQVNPQEDEAIDDSNTEYTQEYPNTIAAHEMEIDDADYENNNQYREDPFSNVEASIESTQPWTGTPMEEDSPLPSWAQHDNIIESPVSLGRSKICGCCLTEPGNIWSKVMCGWLQCPHRGRKT